VNEGGDPYLYPGTSILRNRLGITDAVFLDRQERSLVVLRARRDIPRGSFDLSHLRAIHRHLFQDVYDWAGELRTVEISKGDQQFQFRKYILTGMADVHGRLVRSRFLKGLSSARFAEQASVIVGDINYIHPSVRETGARSFNSSSNSRNARDTVSIWRRSRLRAGSRPRFRAIPPTTDPWRRPSPRPSNPPNSPDSAALTRRAAATISLPNRRQEAAACILTT
jgi:Fic/DOC family